MEQKSTVSIITPSYNMLDYLKRCSASVADQQGVTCEHIIVDGASNDGTQEWLANHTGITSISETDAGMYQAINKGIRLAEGDIIAYLNCDEQYLPGTLKYVHDYFECNPDIDILFGDMLMVNPDGTLIAYRKTFKPSLYYILSSYLYAYTCTMFFRRKIVQDGIMFDENYMGIGDLDFVVRLLRKGYKTIHVSRYFSAFTITGNNICINNEEFMLERKSYTTKSTLWLKLMKYPLNLMRLLEKAINGAYYQKMPLEYALYSEGDLENRKLFKVTKATFFASSRR